MFKAIFIPDICYINSAYVYVLLLVLFDIIIMYL